MKITYYKTPLSIYCPKMSARFQTAPTLGRTLLLLLSLLCAQNATAQTYCASKGNAPWTEWIANVQFGPLNNASQKEGYGNFTSQTASVAQGQTYPLTITQGFSWAPDPTNATQQGRAWIDYNKNGIFEDTEIVANFTRNSVTTNVLIPSTAPVGTTRMRISLKTIGLPTACEVFDKGEVEDYTVNITSGTGGGTLPDLTIANVVTPPFANVNGFLNFSFHLKNLGAEIPALPYGSYIFYTSYSLKNTAVGGQEYNLGYDGRLSMPSGFDTLISSSTVIPSNVPTGSYLLHIITDRGNDILESNETNNVVDIPIEIRAAITDNTKLHVLTASGATTGDPNGTLPLSITIKNESTLPSLPDSVLMVSRRPIGYNTSIYGSRPYSLNKVAVPAIAPNQTIVVSANFILPSRLNTDFLSNVNKEPFIVTDIWKTVNSYVPPVDLGLFYPIQPLAVADLALTGTQFNTTWDSLNNTIDLSYTIRNNGPNTAKNVYVNIDAASITNSSLTFNGTAIGSFTLLSGTGQLSAVFIAGGGREENGTQYRLWNIPELAAGATATATIRGKVLGYQGVPQDIAYYYKDLTLNSGIIYADARDNNAANNTVPTFNFRNVLFVDNRILPDLTLANLTIPTPSVQQGNILNFKFDAKNIGTGAATGSFTIKSYLSTDQFLDASDYQNGSIPTANYAVGQNILQIDGAMFVSNAVAAGNYYLLLKIDADNQIAEKNEDNNVIYSSGLITVSSVLTNSCRYKDSLQLVSLYQSTAGAYWTTKWDLSKPIDTWYGVALDPEGCVRAVALPNNNLQSRLPDLNLPKLTYLGLDDNKMTGELPLSLNLPNLTQLFLNKNQFFGSLGYLLYYDFPNLTDIYLGDNQFSGTIANFNFPKLTGLFLYKNQLSGVLPNFNLLPNLKSLVLYTNQLSGSIPDFNIPTLVTLVIDSNQLSGTIPNFNLPNLVNLSLVNNQLSGTIPSFNLPFLAYLHLEKNKLSGCIPLALKAFCGKNVDISTNPNLATQDFAAFCSTNSTGACNVTTANCVSKGNLPWNEWIAGVQFANINNPSQKEGYGNFTSLTANVTQGQSYPLSITKGFSWAADPSNQTQQWAVWIDYNKNNVFDANELAASGNRNATTANITIPTTATIGTTRMRVSLKTIGVPTACETFDKGEVEDYTVNISAGTGTSTCLNTFYLQGYAAPQCISAGLSSGVNHILYQRTQNIGDGFVLSTNNTNSRSTFFAKNGSTTAPVGSNFPNCAGNWTYFTTEGVGVRFDTRDTHIEYTQVFMRVKTFGTGTNTDSIYVELDKALVGLPDHPIFFASKFKALDCSGRCFSTDVTPPSFSNCPTGTIDYQLTVNTVFNNTYLSTLFQNLGITDSDNCPDNPRVSNNLNYYFPNNFFLDPDKNFNLKAVRYDSAGNKGVCAFTIRTLAPVVGNQPDLTLTNLTIPTPSVQQGQVLSFKADFKNIGTGAASGNFTVKSYLSTDQTLSANDYADGTIPTGNYAAGFTVNQVPAAMTVNSTVAAGQYYLILKIDADNQVAESNENNNIIVSTGLITVTGTTGGGGSDIALTMTATPSVYRSYTTQNFRITATNSGTTAFSNVKIKFTRPTATSSGGTKVASIGTFQDYCPGGIECSEWTIPTLAGGATATLDAPIFILAPTGAITATAALLSSTPTDNTTANNTASVTLNSANAPITQPLVVYKPTQLIPVVIQKISPTLADGEITMELESLIEKTIDFGISNAMGQTVLMQQIPIEKGMNKVGFDVLQLPQGLYFIQTNVGKGRNVPTKFIKL
jgi:Leucine-rich repeat (LRR) protein